MQHSVLMPIDIFERSVTDFVSKQISDHVESWEARGCYPCNLHREAGGAGILALGIAHDSDPCAPLAAGLARKALFMRGLAACGAQSVAIGLGSHFVPLTAIARGDRDIAGDIAPMIWAGERTIALALTEPHGGSSLRDVRTRARRVGAHFRLAGGKAFVCNGTRADHLLVSACIDDGAASLFLVENGEAVEKRLLAPLGWRALPQTHLTFRDAPALLVGEPGDAVRLLRPALALERINLAILAVTSARLLLDGMVAHACARQVDGQVLIDKQAPAHRLAACATQLRMVEAFLDTLVGGTEDDGVPAALPDADIAVAKNGATRLLEHVSREAVQIAGAWGCIAPSLAERMFRDARVLAIGGGTEEIMNEIIVRALRRASGEHVR